WNSNWRGVLVRYRGAGLATAALQNSETVETLTGAGSTLYRLTHNVNELSTKSSIPDWPAFDDEKIYGLDANQKYWLEPIPRPTTTHITRLPVGNQLGDGTLITSKFAHVEIVRSASQSFDFMADPLRANIGVRFQGKDAPLTGGAEVRQALVPVG